jgi:hypothetical protein
VHREQRDIDDLLQTKGNVLAEGALKPIVTASSSAVCTGSGSGGGCSGEVRQTQASGIPATT